MIWIVPALIGLPIVYLAMRFSRFRHWAEPVLSILVAIGLLSAFLVWMREGNSPDQDQPPPFSQTRPTIPREDIALADVDFSRNGQDRSYKATGKITNNSAFIVEFIRLSATLQDCPSGTCKTIGDDSALVLARLAPGQSQTFETFFTFPNPLGIEPRAPKWDYRISEVSGRSP